MSHTTTIKAIKISSIPALRAAVADLQAQGIECHLVENAKPRAYSDNQAGMGIAPFVIQLPKARFDIGIYASEEGGYEARTDFHGGTVAAQVGGRASAPERAQQAQLGKLYQAYGVAAVMEAARKKGQVVRKTMDATTGRAVLEITGNF